MRIVRSSTSGISSSGYTVSESEERVIIIPQNSSKVISEYLVNTSLYKDCDLVEYPKKNSDSKLVFTKNDSPFTFSNRITYYVGNSVEPIEMVNSFYVSEIANYSESDVVETRNNTECGRATAVRTRHFKDSAPDKFYVKYQYINTAL